MSTKIIKLRPLVVSEEKKLDTPLKSTPITNNNVIKKSVPQVDVFTVTKANAYDDKIIDEKLIATATEATSGKIFLSLDAYQKNLHLPHIQKSRKLANIHEFLFDLAYMPFVKIPVKDYRGHYLVDV